MRKLTFLLRVGRRTVAAVFLASLLAMQTIVIPVFAQPANDLDSVREGFPAYEEGCGDGTEGGLGQSAEGIDKFLQVLAYQEGNQPDNHHRPSPGATGKYQYQDPTWDGVTKTGYVPANKYARAYQAPENMQDATAYIEYLKKFKTFNNDILKIAISHYLPAANDDPGRMDVVPPGNTLTPRQYGEKVKKMYDTDGPWSKIKIDYKSAPEIEEYAKKYGGDLTAATGDNLNNVKYKAVGDIPAAGMDVGASIYGGKHDGNKWVPTNDIQFPEGKGTTNEDNGDSATGPLPGKTAFAELSKDPVKLDFAALGDLQMYTKLAVTYKGKTIIAEKRDRGGGGGPVEGKPRAIDMWWEAARLLDLRGNGVVTVRGVEDDTKVTPVGGEAMAAGEATNDNSMCEIVCGTSSGAILLDPGHSGTDSDEKDENGLIIGDSSNPTERKQVFKVAEEVKKTLEKDGYTVEMTKDKEDQTVNLKQRAAQANKIKATLAVSIHSTGGEFKDTGATWSTPQEVGQYREGTGGKLIKFNLPEVATESQRVAKIIAEERGKTEDREVQVRPIVFDGRDDRSGGNIPIVQLYSKVPWVYQEVGQNNWNDDNAEKYAKGIINGIKKAIDKKKGGMADESCGGGSGSLRAKAEGLAWHDGRKSHTPRSTYPKAVKASNAGVPLSAIEDCGVFVATVVRDSKIDPDYPGIGTFIQAPYLKDKEKNKGKWDFYPNLNSTSQLKDGDVFIVNKGSGAGAAGHTYMYIGAHGKWNAASASLNSYMPTYNVVYFEDTIGRGHYGVGRFTGNQTPGENI